MGEWDYGVNDAEAVKLWARGLNYAVQKNSWAFKRFLGSNKSSVIEELDDARAVGDRIRTTLRMNLSDPGVQGDARLKGSEEALTTYTDNVTINQLRHATTVKGRMSQQRVPFDMRKEARDALQDWWTVRMDEWFFNQVCGNTAQSDTRYTGNQATTAPSTNRHFWANAITADASLNADGTDAIDLDDIHKVVANIKTFAAPKMRPINIAGGQYYVCVLHPYQVHDLKDSSGDWWNLMTNAMQGGRIDDNPLFTGSLGSFEGVIFMESENIPEGVNSGTDAAITSTRRAVFLGAQAACFATGRREYGTPSKYTWVEESEDYENSLGVAAGIVGGLKKLTYNSEDYGCCVLATDAVAP